MSVVKVKTVPDYFKSILAITDEGRERWHDEFCDNNNIIVLPHMLTPAWKKLRYCRNTLYSKWIASKFYQDAAGECHPLLKGKQMSWQVIQILRANHSESTRQDWWEPFQDCLFRVFTQPETCYDEKTGEHKQWYLLSPEDSYLVLRYEMIKKGITPPPRNYNGEERFLSANPKLRQSLLVPVECCRHWRHETKAGVLPDGL